MARLRLRALKTRLVGPVDLALEAGDILTLTGPSGSGKTRLLRAIADLDPHEGEAWLDDAACHAMDPPLWRAQVAYLPAESAWWGERVSEHFGQPGALKLETLGLGPETLDWPVTRLSSGERQRLAVLRLLAIRPKVLLLDEPTANLDPDNTRAVETLILDYARETGATLVWVSHDPDQRRRLDGRHQVMSAGQLQEAG
ncbi:MAG: ATP-binding cassette domain-containing protein [Pseudomonadota bacterium]